VFNFLAKFTETRPPLPRRVLIVDPDPNRARALAELLRGLGVTDVWAAVDGGKARKLAAKVNPEAVFCELASGKLDGAAFTRALRRSDLTCRKAPVILVTAAADPQVQLAARDAGAHEVLRRPVLAKDLARRLEAAVLRREWVEAMDYVGPDRRAFGQADYKGPLKRQADAPVASHAVRVGEALKIVRAALAALEREPEQARRALRAQASLVIAVAAETTDSKMANAVEPLATYLKQAGADLDPAQTRRAAEPLLTYGGREERQSA
jgi:CheY-like chemotaxis protein